MTTPTIDRIEVFRLEPPPPEHEGTTPWRPGWHHTFRQATPFDRFDTAVNRYSLVRELSEARYGGIPPSLAVQTRRGYVAANKLQLFHGGNGLEHVLR